MTELRVYLPIEDLQPQFAAYLSSPTRARGYPPFEGQHSLIIEVAPALAIHRITGPSPQIQSSDGTRNPLHRTPIWPARTPFRQDGGTGGCRRRDPPSIGAKPQDQLRPQILYHDIIEDLSDQHAIILNRSRDASILVPGVALLIYEMAPALFACVAANEAERAALTP